MMDVEGSAAASSDADPANGTTEQFTFFWRSASPFSQWHRSKFTVNGVTFNCAEQFMMYSKAELFKDAEIAEKILQSDDPKEQKSFGRKVKGFVQEVWDENCVRIVKEANRHKFSQNPKLLKELLRTKGTTLVEASPVDTIWGIGLAASDPRASDRQSWRGTNLLGQVLTEVRDELLREADKARK